MRIAVILCCYNRKRTTRRCLLQLYAQAGALPEHRFQVYVCDDASTDGTEEMIAQEFPQARLLKSGGNLYWCKSMHMGMQEAVKADYDLYLMVNDDVDFFEDALRIMLESHEKAGGRCGIVGTTKAVCGEGFTYGGRDEAERPVLPGSQNQECLWANWNCFLTDREVIGKVGIIDGKYQHAFGDYDYSHRMRKMGFSIYVADDYIGQCDVNSPNGGYRDKTVKRAVRFKKFFGPKGMPFCSYVRYHLRTGGKGKMFYYLYGYLSMIGYILLGKDLN